jgi:hypothetical protein
LQQEFKTLFGGDKAVTKRMKLDIEIILSNLTIRGIKKNYSENDCRIDLGKFYLEKFAQISSILI